MMSLAHTKYKRSSHVSLYLEEHSVRCQADIVRKLAGCTFIHCLFTFHRSNFGYNSQWI
jgi:hypothetical protein